MWPFHKQVFWKTNVLDRNISWGRKHGSREGGLEWIKMDNRSNCFPVTRKESQDCYKVIHPPPPVPVPMLSDGLSQSLVCTPNNSCWVLLISCIITREKDFWDYSAILLAIYQGKNIKAHFVLQLWTFRHSTQVSKGDVDLTQRLSLIC